MRRVAIKSAVQQADALTLSARELLVAQRTQTINALRGHAAEFGVVAAGGTGRVAALLAAVAQDAEVPRAARRLLAFLGQQVAHLDREIAKLDAALMAQHKANPVSRLLAEIPGIGPIGAPTLAVGDAGGADRPAAIPIRPPPGRLDRADAARALQRRQAAHGRHQPGRPHGSSPWARVPRRLRQLLVLGATAIIRYAKPGRASAWLLSLLESRAGAPAAQAGGGGSGR